MGKMNVLALTGLLLLQVVLVISAGKRRVDLADLISRVSDKKGEQDGDYIKVCSQEPIELGLVIDSSVSIPRDDFKRGQQFLGDFLSGYDIGPGRKQVRVAAVTFGKGVYIKDSFNLNAYKTKVEVMGHVTNMKFRYGSSTDTGDAIEYMREVQMSNTRPWAPKIVIVLTDGNSQRRSWTRKQAALATEANITMFAVGVGRSVSWLELINIAGGDPKRVIRAKSYDKLDEDIKDNLAKKTCVLKPRPTTTTPKPTTTTTTPPPAHPCKVLYQSDINFVFNPASLGVNATGWVTQFISHTITDEELESGFQYGVVTGDCPDDEGFELNRYNDVKAIRQRLEKYDRNNLPALVRKTSVRGFTTENGGRPKANKIAVVFMGKAKVDQADLNKAIQELQATGVQVFVSRTDPGVKPSTLPAGVRLLDFGSSISQASKFVSHICHMEQKE